MADDTAPAQLRVGRLTKAHGLKGALKLELYTDDPERRFTAGALFSLQVPAESPWQGRSLELAELRWYNGHPVGFFVGVEDRTAAETLVKAILWVDRDEAEEPEPDAWYAHQLVGLSVLRDAEQVGTVVRLEHFPAQDLLIVRTETGEVMVPFVSAIVPAVDIDAGTITVTPPDGLFEQAEAHGSSAADGASEATPDAASGAVADAASGAVADVASDADGSAER